MHIKLMMTGKIEYIFKMHIIPMTVTFIQRSGNI